MGGVILDILGILALIAVAWCLIAAYMGVTR
jgi:hypothetical protein